MQKIYLKSFIPLVTLLLTTSCKKKESSYAIMQGKVENVEKLILKASFGTNNSDKILKINRNGEFKDTIYTNEGLYNIFDGKNFINFYIQPAKEYIINYDAANFKEKGIELSGDNIAYNVYFTKKSQNRVFIDPTSISEESKFRTYLSKIKKNKIEAIDNSKLSEKLKIYERNKVNYEYLRNLILFLYNSGTQKPSNLTKQELDINYNNEEHFKTYGPYNSLVYEYYSIRLRNHEKKKKKIDSSYSRHQDVFRFYAAEISNELIKNSIIQLDALDYFKQAKDKRKYYQDFQTYYTGNDSLFIKNMLESYTNLTKLEIGSKSPEFKDFQNFRGGKNSLEDYFGKPIYINLWATWCGVCYGQMEPIKELVKDYKNIQFLSIAYQDKEKKWKKG